MRKSNFSWGNITVCHACVVGPAQCIVNLSIYFSTPRIAAHKEPRNCLGHNEERWRIDIGKYASCTYCLCNRKRTKQNKTACAYGVNCINNVLIHSMGLHFSGRQRNFRRGNIIVCHLCVFRHVGSAIKPKHAQPYINFTWASWHLKSPLIRLCDYLYFCLILQKTRVRGIQLSPNDLLTQG